MTRLLALTFAASMAAWAQSPAVNYRVSTFAGTSRFRDAVPGTDALLKNPDALVYDSKGSLFVADRNAFVVRRLDESGASVVVAGNGNGGSSGDGGPAKSARVLYPQGLALDSAGNLYITEALGNKVRRVTPSGTISTFVGTGEAGFSGDGGAATSATLNSPGGLAFDLSGNLLICDTGNRRVRKVAPNGTITTLAGTGTSGSSGDGGPAASAQLMTPVGIAVDPDGSIYIADYDASRIRVISPVGTISTFAGNGTAVSTADGQKPTTIANPYAVAVGNGIVYFIEYSANRVRSVGSSGLLGTVAGPGFGFSGDRGPATSAGIAFPRGLAVNGTTVAIADSENSRIRVIEGGTIRTVLGRDGALGDGGPATQAVFNTPTSIALSSNGTLAVSDRNNFRIRTIGTNGVINTIAGTGVPGFNSGAVATTPLRTVEGLAYSVDGVNLSFTTSLYNAVMNVSATSVAFISGSTSGVGGFAGDGAAASSSSARFNGPTGIAADARNWRYIADQLNHRIRLLSFVNGVYTLSTVAGNGTGSFSGDGGAATSASLRFPNDVALAPNGDLIIADQGNNRIRRVDSTGKITTIAGGGTNTGEFVAATSARVTNPTWVAVDADGNVYFTDNTTRVRVIRTDGIVYTIAGALANGFAGDGRLGADAVFFTTGKILVDALGKVYVTDSGNDRIRLLTPLNPESLAVASGNGQTGTTGTKAAQALKAVVTASDGTPLPNIPVTFKVESGAATLGNVSATTGADGTASAELTFGATAGQVVVSVSSGKLSPARFTLTSTAGVAANPNQPAIRAAQGVITAGAWGLSPVIASNTWVEIYGNNLSRTTREWAGSDFNGSVAPKTLDGIKVSFNGIDGFISRVSPTQLNVNVPDGILAEGQNSGTVQVRVTTPDGTSDPITVQAARSAPGVLSPWGAYSNGKPYVYATFPDGTYLGPENLVEGLPFRRAKPGDLLTLFAVGLGATNPASAAGVVVGATAPLASPAKVKIGGVDANVTFSGLIGGAIGLYQINLVIPQAGSGDQTFTIYDAAGNAMPQSYLVPMQ